MKKIPKAIYMTADELDLRIRDREAEVERLAHDCERRQTILKEVARLRIYAEAKRWLGARD